MQTKETMETYFQLRQDKLTADKLQAVEDFKNNLITEEQFEELSEQLLQETIQLKEEIKEYEETNI